jgi:5'-3' exonuclease
MGIKGLYSYLKHYRDQIDLEVQKGPPLRIGVDAMSILYRYRGDTEAIVKIIAALRTNGHKVFFVFDGKPPPEKEREVAARRDAKETAAASAASIAAFLGSAEAAALPQRDRAYLELSLERSKSESWHMTRDSRRAFQERLWKEGVPYVKSMSEADDVLMDLVNAGKLDVILTTDMDYLLAEAPTLWIPTRRGGMDFEQVRLADILEGEALTPAAFQDACLLCGTEEREGAKGVPPHTAFAWMRHYGSLEAALRSNLSDRTFRAMFPDVAAIGAARQARATASGAYERIRPDHLERVREFLDGL